MTNFNKIKAIGFSVLILTILNVTVTSVYANNKMDISNEQNSEPAAPKIKFSKIRKDDKKIVEENIEKQLDQKLQLEKQFQDSFIKLSKKFVKSIQDGNQSQFEKCFDKESIVKKSLKDSIQNLGDLTIKRDKILLGISNVYGILSDKIGTRGHIKYLRLVKHDETYHGLVRIKYHSGEITYLELIPSKVESKDSNKEIKIVDFIDLMLGRSYTTIVSQMLVTPEQKTNDPNKILFFTKKPTSFQQRYAEVIRFYKKGEYQEALKSLQLLPVKFKNTKNILLLRVQIAKASNPIAYREALLMLKDNYSSDPDLGLILADHYFFTKQYPLAVKSIEKFSDYIGNDIALDNLRVKINITQKHFDRAIQIGSAAIEKDKNYEDIYWLMLKAYLYSYQYQHVGGILDVLLDKYKAEFDIDTFYKDPFYREYGFSKQFKKWKESRIAKTSN